MENPAIVQSDRTILLEVDNPLFEAARDALAVFSELIKSPEHIHTYRITPISLWNAASLGYGPNKILKLLSRYSRYDVPENISREISDFAGRYGELILEREGELLVLRANDTLLLSELANHSKVEKYIIRFLSDNRVSVRPELRGHIKQALIKIGWPVEDRAGFEEGDPFEVKLRETTLCGQPFVLRDYQLNAVRSYEAGKGGGVIVLPCGAGKTIVGIGAMAKLNCKTLILSTSVTAVRQWIRELTDKTYLTADDVGEYTGERKEIKPITITTFQMISHRPNKLAPFPHFAIFDKENWGLIIYDEVHLLPAPVFRITAELQSKRRLGLTATLVREDGRESDVFSLIGPKRYDVPWKELESQGWIAKALCTEVRLPLPDKKRVEYAVASPRTRYRIAAENPDKFIALDAILKRHTDDNILVIGQYLDQLASAKAILKAPLITGRTSAREREHLYGAFRSGDIKLLIVSKVANFAVDLPDANVLVQLSGTFGSRQEEAQRLGRILRPKVDGSMAHFYSLITRNSDEMSFASKRQLFLTEQGYKYKILDVKELCETS